MEHSNGNMEWMDEIREWMERDGNRVIFAAGGRDQNVLPSTPLQKKFK